jgi:hypothetical protein
LTVTTAADFTGATVLHVVQTWTQADGSTARALVSDNVESYAIGSPIFAISGDDNLTGAATLDQFVFAQPIGHDKVFNFDTANDQIDLIGYAGFTTFADVQANLADDLNGNAVLTLGSGQSITLVGVQSASLSAGNFAFDQTPVTDNAGMMAIDDGALLPLSGIINNSGTIALNDAGSGTELELIQHGVTLQGGGQVTLSDSSANMIIGTASDVVLTNADNTISGAGQIGEGQLTLVNSGAIIATGVNALTLDTGANVIVNSGILEATGSGGLIIASGVANSGSLWANGGSITVQGAVTGAGGAQIDGIATIEFGTDSSANLVFAADASGVLKLDHATGFTGSVTGFDGNDSIDLADIEATTATASFAANADASGGTLTVSDGTHTANILLHGQYDPAAFHLAADSGIGVVVTYPDHLG